MVGPDVRLAVTDSSYLQLTARGVALVALSVDLDKRCPGLTSFYHRPQ